MPLRRGAVVELVLRVYAVSITTTIGQQISVVLTVSLRPQGLLVPMVAALSPGCVRGNETYVACEEALSECGAATSRRRT